MEQSNYKQIYNSGIDVWYYLREQIVLSNGRKTKKADSDKQDKIQEWDMTFDEQPWLQLMYCAPVSGCEVGCLFWNEGKSTE